jgi:antitoxin HicB
MRLTYTVLLLPEPEGEFTVEVPALPGCFSRGKTIIEALRNVEEAISCHVGSLMDHGDPIPEENGTIPVNTEDLTEGLLFRVSVALVEAMAA